MSTFSCPLQHFCLDNELIGSATIRSLLSLSSLLSSMTSTLSRSLFKPLQRSFSTATPLKMKITPIKGTSTLHQLSQLERTRERQRKGDGGGRLRAGEGGQLSFLFSLFLMPLKVEEKAHLEVRYLKVRMLTSRSF